MAGPLRHFDVFWPLHDAYLKNADVGVVWARPSETSRLPPRVRSLCNRRHLSSLHRHVERLLYFQAGGHATPCVVVARLHDDLHVLLVADVQAGAGSPANTIRVVLSTALVDVVNFKVGDPAYDDRVLPHLRNALEQKSPS